MPGPLRAPYDRPGRALHLGGLRQLPARRPLAAGPGRARPRPERVVPLVAARELLGLHRLEGPVCPAARSADRQRKLAQVDAGTDRLYAPGDAAGAGFQALGRAALSTRRWPASTRGRRRRASRSRLRGGQRDSARGRGPGGAPRPGPGGDAALYLASLREPARVAASRRGEPGPHARPRLRGASNGSGPIAFSGGRIDERRALARCCPGRSPPTPGWPLSCRTAARPRCCRP